MHTPVGVGQSNFIEFLLLKDTICVTLLLEMCGLSRCIQIVCTLEREHTSCKHMACNLRFQML